MKEIVRRVLFPISGLFSGGSFYAEPGTLKFRFLMWLYGDPEQAQDGWIYPEDNG